MGAEEEEEEDEEEESCLVEEEEGLGSLLAAAAASCVLCVGGGWVGAGIRSLSVEKGVGGHVLRWVKICGGREVEKEGKLTRSNHQPTPSLPSTVGKRRKRDVCGERARCVSVGVGRVGGK